MPIHRHIKNVVHNYTDAERKVREATSNDPWGPSSTLMAEIADKTHNVMAFTEIMQMIWRRLNDKSKNWRHVYKSLVLLDYLTKTGSDKVATQCRENIHSIETLKVSFLLQVMIISSICGIIAYSHCRGFSYIPQTNLVPTLFILSRICASFLKPGFTFCIQYSSFGLTYIAQSTWNIHSSNRLIALQSAHSIRKALVEATLQFDVFKSWLTIIPTSFCPLTSGCSESPREYDMCIATPFLELISRFQGLAHSANSSRSFYSNNLSLLMFTVFHILISSANNK
ncbi:unnamed protein product [Trichobilharzia regenti]|nr:unnamed protein product [Trichobilharzia regenti]